MLDHVNDLADVEGVGRVLGIENIGDVLWKLVLLERVGVQLLADEGELGLLEGDSVRRGDWSELGQSDLVAVTAGLAAQDAEVLAVLVGEEADGEVLVLLHEAVGVALRVDIDGHGRLALARHAPERAQAAPGDGHTVVFVKAACRGKSPVVVEHLKHVVGLSFELHPRYRSITNVLTVQ